MQKARSHHTKWLLPLVSIRFQVLFHSAVRGSFHLSFTVLVRYRCLRSIQPYQMVLADSHKASPTSRYSGYYYVNNTYVYRTITLYGSTFKKIQLRIISQYCSPTTPRRYSTWFGLFPFRSPLLRKSLDYFLFLGVLRCFSSPGSLHASMILYLQYRGFPHSEIIGSMVMCTSPKLIAAYHVLHRLSDPRHPPYALSNFQILINYFFYRFY